MRVKNIITTTTMGGWGEGEVIEDTQYTPLCGG